MLALQLALNNIVSQCEDIGIAYTIQSMFTSKIAIFIICT